MPVLTVIAGPNGSGKSTITRSVRFKGIDRLLDPDAIARQMNPQNPALAALSAGREALRLQKEYLANGFSFIVETTLSGHGNLDLLKQAKERGYLTRLIFVFLESPERSVMRVADRVAKGGHFVPDADVRRRYARSIENAIVALRLVDVARFYDNSSQSHRLVLQAKAGKVSWRADRLPEWLHI